MGIVFASGTQSDVPNVLSARIAASNQTSMEFTVPSGVYKIEILFDEISTNGGSPVGVQVYNGTSWVTSGYIYSSNFLHSTTGSTRYTDGFMMRWEDAAALRTGCMTLWNTNGNVWVARHLWGNLSSGSYGCSIGGGRTDIGSSTLTKVRIRAQNGTDVFDSGHGQVNLFYE